MSECYELLAIGGGAAGMSAVRSFRDAGGEGRVGLVTDERRIPYSRPPLSKDLLRGEADERELPLADESWFAEHQVGLIGGRAVRLDASNREVLLSGGRQLAYLHCLLATGSEPKRLPIPGADDPGVRVLRSLDDLRDLQRRRIAGAAIAVIGSGFIGCEIAASLRMLGHPVTLISDEPAPNEPRLGRKPAQTIAEWLQNLGVMLVLEAEVQAIERATGTLHVQAADHRATGDTVVMATGVAPRSELASAAGLELIEGAVPTDAAMQTATPGLLAAGDVAAATHPVAGRRLRVEHWGDALTQGEVAGQTAAGLEAAWDAVPGFWSTIGAKTLKYAAWGDGFDDVRFEPRDDGAFAAWYGRDGQTVGVLTHELDPTYERGRELIAQGAPWN